MMCYLLLHRDLLFAGLFLAFLAFSGLICSCSKGDESDDITPQQPTRVVDGMSNCYRVAPGGKVGFKVSRAYTYSGGAFTTTLQTGGAYTGGFDAAVVWADAAVIDGIPTVTGTGSGAIATVRTKSGVSGNAVVAIKKKGTNDIVWSYHIWVTDYNPNAGATYKANTAGYTFMDRNLGATKAGGGSGLGTGLFYQWGRKDPFPATGAIGATQAGGGTFTAVATSATVGTVAYTLTHPNLFIYQDSDPYDWYYGSTRNDELWGHSGNKTIYDPCPSGWRVPRNNGMSDSTSPWYGFTVSNGGTWSNGYTWGINATYPAAGYRSANGAFLRAGGSPLRTGGSGFYWAASPSGSSSLGASGLDFDNGYVYVDSYAVRAIGVSVRCVRE
jgi:hypothetical protein